MHTEQVHHLPQTMYARSQKRPYTPTIQMHAGLYCAHKPPAFNPQASPAFDARSKLNASKYGKKKAFDEQMDIMKEKGMHKSSHWGGESREGQEITMEQFKKICEIKKDGKKLVEKYPEKAEKYLRLINQAFAAMGIDTVETQAMYLAQSMGETGFYRLFTETQSSANYYEDNPDKAPHSVSELKKVYPDQEVPKPGGKKGETMMQEHKHIKRFRRHNFDFIGRSGLQITFSENYQHALAVLAYRADQIRDELKDAADAAKEDQLKQIEAAIEAIGKDPRQASNPEFGFLLSAAYAKIPAFAGKVGHKNTFHEYGGVDRAHQFDPESEAGFVNDGSRFMTGGNITTASKAYQKDTNGWATTLRKKHSIFQRAVEVLRSKDPGHKCHMY